MMGVDIATEIKAFRVGPGRGGPAAEPSPEEGEKKTCRWKFSCRLYTFQLHLQGLDGLGCQF
jgi:hypothetical protein